MKFKWNPVKNIDYIIDYYAILELDRFSQSNLKKQFHKLSKQNHPDTVSTSSEDIQRLADKKFRFINEAYKLLTDKKLKKVYDEQLTKFIEEKPTLISDDGTAIISLSQESLSLDFLLSGAISFDFQNLQEEKSSSLIGFNQKTLDVLENLHLLNTEDEDLKEAYLEQLNKKKMTLDWKETFAWQEMGIMNPKEVAYQNADEYLELITDKIIKIESNFNNLAEVRLLGCETQPLFIGSNIKVSDPTNESNITVVKENLTKEIKLRKEKIVSAAKEKQEFLKKIVKVRTYKQIKKVDNKNISIFLHNKENKILLNFIVDLEKDQEVIINSMFNDKDINECILSDKNTYLLKFNPELDMAFQVLEFINDVANNYYK